MLLRVSHLRQQAILFALMTVMPALFPVSPVFAGPARVIEGRSHNVELQNLTWVEVQDRLKNGTTSVIIPTGGTEQNGRHMILGKHNYIVEKTAERIANTLGNTLVAPVLAYVPEGDPSSKSGHMAYPGTISLTDDVFESVLSQAAQSLKTHGFKTIILLGDSGGNQMPQERVAAELDKAWASDGVRVIHASDYYGNNNGTAYLIENGETEKSIGTHAGIRDTSELMAAYPQGVDLENAIADKDGTNGDPSRATRAHGEALLKQKVDAAVAQIRRAMGSSDALPPSKKTDNPGFLVRMWRAIFG